jgi:polyhydroxyalkanoate synthesis regulator phasin
MSNAFEKSTNLGLGLLLYSREKVEKFVEELVDKGDVAKKDARQFAAELVQRGEEQQEELKKLIRGEVAKALDFANVAKKEDVATKDEIAEIVREQVQQALREHGYPKKEDTE